MEMSKTSSAGVRPGDCDRGEWAFRGGRAVPLGPVPALIHYEKLHERPGPHFVDEAA